VNKKDITFLLRYGFLKPDSIDQKIFFNRTLYDYDDAIIAINSTLQRILKKIPSENLTVLLSGGIDSTVILVNAVSAGIPVKSLSIKFDDYDESSFAKRLSEHLNCKNETIEYSFDYFKVFFENMLSDKKILVSSAAMVVFSDVLSRNNGDFINGAASDEGLFGYDYQVKFLKKINRKNQYQTLFPKGFNELIPKHSLLNEFFANERLDSFFHDDYMPIYLDDEELFELFSVKTDKNFPFILKDAFDELIRFQYEVLLPECQLKRLEGISKYSGRKIFVPYAEKDIINVFNSLSNDLILRSFKRKYILYECVRQNIPEELYLRDKFPFTVPINKWFLQNKEWVLELVLYYGGKHNIDEKKLKWVVNKNLNNGNDYNAAEKLLLLIGTLAFFSD